MEDLFKWGKNLLGSVPGLTVIFYNLWVPSEIPRVLLGGIIEAVGVFTIIVFHQKDIALKKRSSLRLTKSGIIFCALFLFSLLIYVLIYDCQNIYNSKYDVTILIPFWKSNDLNYMITKAGSANSAILEYGPEAIRKAINDGIMAYSATKILFIINYVLLFEFLIIGFGFLAVKADDKTLLQNAIQ